MKRKKMGRPPNMVQKIPLSVTVDPELRQRLTENADRLGLSRMELIRRSIKVGLRHYEKKETEETR